MTKFILAILITMTGFQSSISLAHSREIGNAIVEFVNLLVSNNPVFLSDYEKFYGRSAERELEFELRECETRGWDSYSENCVSFTRERSTFSHTANSYFLDFVRNGFSTSGKDYRIVSSTPSTEGFSHSKIEVWIWGNKFELVHNTAPYRPTGILVGISSVNGRSVDVIVACAQAASKDGSDRAECFKNIQYLVPK
jgi:hypothetical protein